MAKRPINDNVSIASIVTSVACSTNNKMVGRKFSEIISTSRMAYDSKEKLERRRSMIDHSIVSQDDSEHFTVTIIKRDGTPVTFWDDDMHSVRAQVEDLIREWKVYLSKIGEVEVGNHSRSMIESYRQLTYGAEPMEIYVAYSYRNDPTNNRVERMTVDSFMSNCGELEDWNVLPDHV